VRGAGAPHVSEFHRDDAAHAKELARRHTAHGEQLILDATGPAEDDERAAGG
jgi:hypothetical protein